VIVWINGAFGAGKTTLAEELSRRLPDAVLFDPEYVGYMLRRWVPVPTGDFQDLPSWRELVVATALSLRKHHSGTLIVPMTLINDDYLNEILGGLQSYGEDVLHAFLDLDPDVLRQRITDPEADQQAREFRLRNLDRGIAAAARTPSGTLLLRSDKLTPAELADEVLSRFRTRSG
jgi:AAA domain-containing protein